MKKLSRRGFSLVEGLLIFVIVTLVAGAGYYVYNRANQDTANTIQTPLSEILGNVSALTSEFDYIEKYNVESKDDYAGQISYTVDGQDYRVIASTYDNYVVLQYRGAPDKSDKAKMQTVADKALGILTDSAFVEAEELGKDPLTKLPYYTRGNEVCQLDSGDASVSVDCTTTQQIAEVAEQIAPQAAAYTHSNPEIDAQKLYFGLDKSGTGDNGHNYARLNMGDSIGYFYTNDEGLWVFSHRNQAGIECGSLDTKAANDAFKPICE